MANEKDHERILKYLPYLSIFLLLIVWELIVDLGVVPKTLLASPVQVVKLFFFKA